MYSRWGLNWKSIWRGQHATHSKTSNNTILQITKRSFTGYQLVPYTHLNICFEHRHLSNTSTMMACSVLNLSSSNYPLFSPSWLIGMHLIWLGRGEKHSDIQRESKHIYDYTRYRVLTKTWTYFHCGVDTSSHHGSPSIQNQYPYMCDRLNSLHVWMTMVVLKGSHR